MQVIKYLSKLHVKIKNKLFHRKVKKTLLVMASSLGFFVARTALATSGNDIDLSSIDNSIQGHISGDFGRLMGLAALAWLIIAGAFGFNMKLLVSVLIVLLAIALGPTIVDQVGSV